MDENVEDYREIIDIDERQFQKISVERHIYPIPVDEVSEDSLERKLETVWPNLGCPTHVCSSHSKSLTVKKYNEQEEEERQVSQHLLFQELFDDKLFFPPIASPKKVLECGYGRGSWAVSMAQTYENCKVSNKYSRWAYLYQTRFEKVFFGFSSFQLIPNRINFAANSLFIQAER